MQRGSLLLTLGAVFFPSLTPVARAQEKTFDQTIVSVLRADQDLREVPFSDVVLAATGKSVLKLDATREDDRRVIKIISDVLDIVMRRMNAADSPVQNVARINEASSHFEDMLRETLNRVPGFTCDFPHTAEDRVQRSGYPDLRLVETATKRIFYLDPKLYAAGSRDSSFRTFYFEPKVTTNKVRDHAVHLLVGFEHEPRTDGRWKFTRWDLVDLSHFKVRLKAEFQASNRDIYTKEAIITTSQR